MAKTRVLIVDDHPVMRRGLREALTAEPELEICAEAADISEAIDQTRKSKPQLAIVDVSLPSGSGLELTKQLLAINSSLRILFVSMHDDAVFAERALRAGALGYINKSRPADELLDAVRKVARGEIALSQPTSDRLVRRGVRPAQQPVTGVESLSDRELEVFELIGRGLGTREIAERLCLSTKTIETHREHIKTKLNLESGTELSRHATLWNNSQS
jgi:DNA-binding NarL/FixJ family response regulator